MLWIQIHTLKFEIFVFNITPFASNSSSFNLSGSGSVFAKLLNTDLIWNWILNTEKSPKKHLISLCFFPLQRTWICERDFSPLSRTSKKKFVSVKNLLLVFCYLRLKYNGVRLSQGDYKKCVEEKFNVKIT